MADATPALQAAQALADQARAELTTAKSNVKASAAAAESAVMAAAKAEVDSIAADVALDAMKVAAGVSSPPAGTSQATAPSSTKKRVIIAAVTIAGLTLGYIAGHIWLGWPL